MRVISIAKGTNLDNLTVSERPDPTPGAGEVLVRWRASSLNFHDLMVASGKLPVSEGRIPLSDGAGEVVALGDGVSQWQVGDKVLSCFFPLWTDGAPRPDTTAMAGDHIDGCGAELSAVPASGLTPMPRGYSFAEAATLPCAALTAWRALIVEGKLKAGDRVLVQGTGGMSIFALQIAKAAGAHVIATSSSAKKLDRLKALGADEVINYKEDSAWGETAYELAGDGVDHVVDAGGPTTLSQSMAAVKMGGHIVLIGVLGGRSAELMLPATFRKHVTLSGIAVGSVAMQKDMVRAFEVNRIKPVIDSHYPLEELGKAFQYQLSGQHIGKIVVDM